MNVEIILNNSIHTEKKAIIEFVLIFLKNEWNTVNAQNKISNFDPEKYPTLQRLVKCILIENVYLRTNINFENEKINWYVYTLDCEGPVLQIEEGGDQDGPIDLATHLILPSDELFNLWENLFYDNDVKENLLQYAQTMMEFSDKGIDPNVISCNRVILLHGPPGTGKTSLCKALAQKLTIRMQDRYNSGILIEINSHSLFSKWFSESGKLVANMFKKIKEVVENTQLLVCVLIDEVESLAHARNQCISGNEPSDSVRVVNAILTQIDQIKRHNNVLILTTSNLTESIDIAFIDRADIKQYIDLPNPTAICEIYKSCLVELHRANIITDSIEECNLNDLNCLLALCAKSKGFSGRSVRKIPFIAHALFLKKPTANLNEFLKSMDQAIDREFNERKFFITR